MGTPLAAVNHRVNGHAIARRPAFLCRETQGREMIAAIVSREVDDAMRLGPSESALSTDRAPRRMLTRVNGGPHG